MFSKAYHNSDFRENNSDMLLGEGVASQQFHLGELIWSPYHSEKSEKHHRAMTDWWGDYPALHKYTEELKETSSTMLNSQAGERIKVFWNKNRFLR